MTVEELRAELVSQGIRFGYGTLCPLPRQPPADAQKKTTCCRVGPSGWAEAGAGPSPSVAAMFG